MNNKTGKVEVPDEGQPTGKSFPPKRSDITGEKEVHLVEGSNRYENLPESTAVTGGDKGPYGVPDDDMAGEGWAPPIERREGWLHPTEPALEEQLDEQEGL